MADLTNNTRKIYASLDSAKGRRENGLFMAQGTKCVLDTIEHFGLHALLATDAWASEHRDIALMYGATIVKRLDLERITSMSTAPDVIAIYRIPTPEHPDIANQLCLALDCVQDPGNLGTIIRVADWMGVRTIIASPDTADVWSPKVVQATMGAISRVVVCYMPLTPFLKAHASMPIYGTFLDGADIYEQPLSQTGIVIMGNEGKGISREVAQEVNTRLFIPSFPPGEKTSESLNVAVATAITLSEFRRRKWQK